MRGRKRQAARATKTLHNLKKKNTNLIAKGYAAAIKDIRGAGFIKKLKILFL